MRRSEIEFQVGSILRKEMLQDLYDYPRIAIESLFSDYSDGILYGLSWKEVEEKHHIICPGALKFHGNIYFLKDDLCVEEEILATLNVNGSYRLCFVCQEPEKLIKSKTDYYLKLMAVQDEQYRELGANAFWYAYIKFSGGKRIEIITGDAGIKYGIPGIISADDGFDFKLPNWLVNQQLLDILEAKCNKHPLDFILLSDIYSGKAISVSFVNMYMNELRKDKIGVDCSPEMVMEKLEEAIKELSFQVSINMVEETEKEKTKEPWKGGSL